tara:strand:+ start:2362 stop:2919 length:558 start_codon:yes stop_codon:yes gene_type:complete
MARSDEKICKVRVSELFMETESYHTGLMKASTFKVRIHRCMQKCDAQHEALALVTEECDSSLKLSDKTAYDEKEVARTCAAGHRQNTQPWFEEAVQNISFGVFTTVEGVGAMQRVAFESRRTLSSVPCALCHSLIPSHIFRIAKIAAVDRAHSAVHTRTSSQKLSSTTFESGYDRETILSMVNNF